MQDHVLDSSDLTWLAGLARALLGDAHAADDLVQETLVAALEGPVPSGAPRRAWLRTVAKRLAARRFRGEARRADRESYAARSEALPDSAELVERAEVAEQVAAAARALPEPFRRTILLRFLEGLEPDEIARRENRPPDTVRWRVRRGLELLRDELVARHERDWSAWCVALIPLARSQSSGVGATASGGLTSTAAAWTLMKLTTSVAAVALAGVGLWFTLDRDNPTTTPEGRADDRPTVERPVAGPPSTASEALTAPATTSARVSAPASAPVDPTVAAAEPKAPSDQIHGVVLDPEGRPVEGADVYLAAPPESDAPTSDRRLAVGLTTSDANGRFSIPWNTSTLSASVEVPVLDLGVAANGFTTAIVDGATADPPAEGLVVTLDRGQLLRGRVVDETGRPVEDLELLAHTAGAPVGHVSPSRVAMRAHRARLRGAGSDYEDCLGRTGANGAVEFAGLAAGELEVRSLDPGWSIVDPGRVVAADGFVQWTAVRRLGVRLEVVERHTGQPVRDVSAVFSVELTFEDGETVDYDQWVGGGEGGASFVLEPSTLPPIAERLVLRAVFYGTVRSGASEATWVADAIESPTGAEGVVDVRVELDTAVAKTSEEGPATVEPAPELPSATLEIDVRRADGLPYRGRLVVEWSTRIDGGGQREGTARTEEVSAGRYRIEVAAGEVTIAVREWGASGSLQPWTDTLRCEPDVTTTAFATLPAAAVAVISRPDGWSGEWWVRAQWRQDDSEPWFGAWNYSTTGESLELVALLPAEWRFELRRYSEQDPDPLVRIAVLGEGEQRVVD